MRFVQPGRSVLEEAKQHARPEAKPFAIPKLMVWEAWRQVKANKGAPGVDGQDLDAFEARSGGQPLQDLESDELGNWFHRRSGQWRSEAAWWWGSNAGVPTIADRVVQTVGGHAA